MHLRFLVLKVPSQRESTGGWLCDCPVTSVEGFLPEVGKGRGSGTGGPDGTLDFLLLCVNVGTLSA